VSTKLLEIDNVTARYGRLPVLHDVSIDIRAGEIVALIGANGAGKTTTMMTIFGRPRATEGRILFDGEDITALPAHSIARLRIAQAPEGRRIFPRMTVLENLQMGAIIADDPDRFARDLDRVCALFPVLKERQDQRGGTLSGGEQQMLSPPKVSRWCRPTTVRSAKTRRTTKPASSTLVRTPKPNPPSTTSTTSKCGWRPSGSNISTPTAT
jgi:branched-chain amino acid transport system ATP-binding protein